MKKIISVFLLAAGAISVNVSAQTSDFAELIPTPYLQKDLTAIAGLGIVTVPKYADGSKQEVLPLPVLDMQWKSGVFFSSLSGYGYNFSQNPSWQYGLRLGLIMNQRQSEKNDGNGPGNTRTNLAPGVFGNYLIDQHYTVLTSLEAGGGIDKQHDGILASVGLRYVDQLDAGNRIYGIVSTTWANLHYMQDYYGVSQAQAAEYNMPEYETKAGILKIKLSSGWNHVIDQRWSLLTGAALTKPLGGESSSPLSSSKIQVVAYTAVYYKF